MTTSAKPKDEQCLKVCDIDGCSQVLHEDIHIHVWENSLDGDWYKNPQEMVICHSCHQELDHDLLHDKGWQHDEEDD